jgi:hypothetical protein
MLLIAAVCKQPPPTTGIDCHDMIFWPVSHLYSYLRQVSPLLLLLCCCCAAAALLLCCCCAAAVLLLCCCCAAAVLLLCCCCAAAVLLLLLLLCVLDDRHCSCVHAAAANNGH